MQYSVVRVCACSPGKSTGMSDEPPGRTCRRSIDGGKGGGPVAIEGGGGHRTGAPARYRPRGALTVWRPEPPPTSFDRAIRARPNQNRQPDPTQTPRGARSRNPVSRHPEQRGTNAPDAGRVHGSRTGPGVAGRRALTATARLPRTQQQRRPRRGRRAQHASTAAAPSTSTRASLTKPRPAAQLRQRARARQRGFVSTRPRTRLKTSCESPACAPAWPRRARPARPGRLRSRR